MPKVVGAMRMRTAVAAAVALTAIVVLAMLPPSALAQRPRASPSPSPSPSPSIPQNVDVLVLGAGVAGLSAARQLMQTNPTQRVLVLEGRNVSGGRIRTIRTRQGWPLDLGAGWVHGGTDSDHPVTQLAQTYNLSASEELDTEAIYENGVDVTNNIDLDEIYEEFFDWLRDEVPEDDTEDRRSVAELFQAYVRQNRLNNRAQQLLRAAIQTEVEQDYATSMRYLSAAQFDMGDAYLGTDTMLNQGYEALIQVIQNQPGAAPVPVVYNQEVVAVDSSNSTVRVTTRTGAVYTARYVICTLPLGVLQAQRVRWTPNLPDAKRRAMYMLNMGTLDKVALVFNDNQRFWDATGDAAWLRRLTNDNSNTPWFEWYSLTNVVNKSALIAFHAGDVALTMEERTDAQLRTGAINALQSMFPRITIPAPQEVYVTRWAQDPWTRGSYSSVRPNATVTDEEDRYCAECNAYQLMAKSVDRKLFFAGEATNGEYPGTVHGALLSGRRAAQEVRSAITAAARGSPA